ncbi:ANTAR domain-containing protein [Glaciibacter sp. 2TAF33]|uniref:ANTAR domain-containing protein n=1 Tax=Glaciibacter sp. 2TAF33 TaxID=3233015 RepID=UPI003F93C330
MNLFFETPGSLEDSTVSLIEAMAQMATISVVQHQMVQSHRIEQAKGILAHRNGSSVNDALIVLRKCARSNSRRLHDVAEQVVRDRKVSDRSQAAFRLPAKASV